MTRDEFIEKYVYFVVNAQPDHLATSSHKEFISDFDDVLDWYKHELWDRWNELQNQISHEAT